MITSRMWSSAGVARPRSGYTLLELSLVLAISALVTASVMLSLRGPYLQARRGELIARIETLDRQLRNRAERDAGGWQLVIDLRAGTLAAQSTRPSEDQPPPVSLGRALTLEEVVTVGRRTSYGRIVIDYGRGGASPSYALRFKEKLEKGSWFLVSGLSGKWERYDDARQLEATLALADPATGPDAD